MARRSPDNKLRAGILFGMLLLGHAVVAGRLFHIQVLDRPRYQAMADKFHVRKFPIPAQRGMIRDRNGEPLAINADAGNISLDPSFYWDEEKWPMVLHKDGKRVKQAPSKDQAARRLAEALQIPYAEIRPKLDKQNRFVWIKRHVPLGNVRRADAADIPGLRIDYELKRVYPMGSLAAHILGNTGIDGHGLSGIEMKFDSTLERHDGSEVLEVDRKGRAIPGTLRSIQEPRDGADITLTIDSRIQQAAERELGLQCEKYNAIGGTCTVIDPRTGEILAMANYPRFDPNRAGDYPADTWRNRAVTDLYEPGSTMKGVTAAAALDAGAVNLTERFNCPGFLRIGKRTIRDVNEGPGSFGSLNMADIMRFSSNVGMSHIGMRLGAKRLDDYLHKFGMLEPSGVELPGEVSSWMPSDKRWDKHFTSTVAFGQSVNFSALRLTNAYAAIANGGVLMKPHVMKSIQWPEDGPRKGEVQTFGPTPIRRVISKSTADATTRLLEGVVTNGTGKPAKVAGYYVAGKTGSAQKAFPGKGYVNGRYIASFIGYVPARNPRAVILVTVDEPKGTHWGAVAAAPVFREVARQTMWFLQVPPDDPEDRVDGAKPSTWRRQVAGR